MRDTMSMRPIARLLWTFAIIIIAIILQNLFAWTNGQQSIYFGRTNGLREDRIEPLRGIRHLFDNTSHDIITYDDYLQPPLDGKMCLVLS